MLTYALKSLVLLLLVFSTPTLDLACFVLVKVLDDEVIVVVVKSVLGVEWLFPDVWGFLLLSPLVIGIIVLVVVVVAVVLLPLVEAVAIIVVVVLVVVAVVTVVLVAVNVVGYPPGAKLLKLSLLEAIVLLLLLWFCCCCF